jgi:hypothetical protein
MAKKISQLSDGNTLTGPELFEIVQNGISRKTTASQIAALVLLASSGVTAWDLSSNTFLPGSIIGQMYYGTKSDGPGSVTTLTDKSGNPLPDEVLAIALVNNASSSSDYMFVNLIF